MKLFETFLTSGKYKPTTSQILALVYVYLSTCRGLYNEYNFPTVKRFSIDNECLYNIYVV